MPDAAMWEKIRRKYKGAMRLACTWNPGKGTGGSVNWPWNQTDPPLWTTKWTVIGMAKWHDLDGPQKDQLDKRNYAASFTKRPKKRGGNKRAAMDPKSL